MQTKKKLTLDRPVIVEGKYDKNTLSQVIDTLIVPVGGFGIFRKEDLRAMLRSLATERGVIVLTDSDGAGKQIRAYLSQVLPAEKVTHLYIPKVPGKERRKNKRSAQGLLGVEGMQADLLYDLFAPFATDAPVRRCASLSKARFYADGLCGRENSAAKRAALAQKMGLPTDLCAGALLACVNLLLTEQEYMALICDSACEQQPNNNS